MGQNPELKKGNTKMICVLKFVLQALACVIQALMWILQGIELKVYFQVFGKWILMQTMEWHT